MLSTPLELTLPPTLLDTCCQLQNGQRLRLSGEAYKTENNTHIHQSVCVTMKKKDAALVLALNFDTGADYFHDSLSDIWRCTLMGSELFLESLESVSAPTNTQCDKNTISVLQLESELNKSNESEVLNTLIQGATYQPDHITSSENDDGKIGNRAEIANNTSNNIGKGSLNSSPIGADLVSAAGENDLGSALVEIQEVMETPTALEEDCVTCPSTSSDKQQPAQKKTRKSKRIKKGSRKNKNTEKRVTAKSEQAARNPDLVCQFCAKVFKEKRNKTFHEKNVCKLKSDRVQIKIEETTQSENKKANDLECQFCHKLFKEKRHRTFHEKKNCQFRPGFEKTKSKDVTCQYCKKIFSSRYVRLSHEKYRCKIIDVKKENEQNSKLEPCGLTESSQNTVTKPFAKYNCNYCGQLFTTDRGKQQHEKYVCHLNDNVEKRYHCKICACFFKTQEDLDKHALLHMKDGIKEFNCQICNLKFISRHAFRAHYRKFHPDETNKFLCKQCSKFFESFNDLTLHKSQAHGLTPKIAQRRFSKICKYCSKQFSSRSVRTVHESHHCLNNPNIKTDKLICDFCQQKFNNPGARKHHEPRCRDNPQRQRIYECGMCTKKFHSRGLYDEHRAEHVANKNKLICPICGMGYGTRGGLYAHNIKYHSNKAPRFQCEHCPKAYHYINQLKIHKLCHTDARNFKCDTCGQTYKSLKDVNRHKQMVHKGQYPFHCTKCGHGVEKRKYLDTHICGRVRRDQRPTFAIDSQTNIIEFKPSGIDSQTNIMEFKPSDIDSQTNIMEFKPSAVDSQTNIIEFKPSDIDSQTDIIEVEGLQVDDTITEIAVVTEGYQDASQIEDAQAAQILEHVEIPMLTGSTYTVIQFQ